MLVKIQASAATLTADEIAEAIAPEVMTRIKTKNQSPYFQAYSLVQEGTSRPRVIGEKNPQSIAWPRRAIETVKNALKVGLQFFGGHNTDNSTSGRKALGEVVGRLAKEIGGRLHEIVIGYFPDKSIAQKMDVCSIEADVYTTEIPGSMTIAEKVESLTGIALGNSAHDKPAFAGAEMLASLQCFEVKKIQGSETPPGGNPMTYQDTIEGIKKFNIHPSQAYTEQEIKNDLVFGPIFTERDSLKTENETLKTEKTDTEKKIKDQDNKILQNDAKGRLTTIIPEGTTDKQKEFISKNFKPESLDNLSDDGLKSFVDSQIKEYNENASFFGDGGSQDNENSNENDDDNKNDDSKEDEVFKDIAEDEKK